MSPRTHPARRARTGRRCLPLARGEHRAHRCRTARRSPDGAGSSTEVGPGTTDRARSSDPERVEGQEGGE